MSASESRRKRRICQRRGHPKSMVKRFEDGLFCTYCDQWLAQGGS